MVKLTFFFVWVLEKHMKPLHLGSTPLITEGKLGATGLQSEKKRGTLLVMIEHFLFVCALMCILENVLAHHCELFVAKMVVYPNIPYLAYHPTIHPSTLPKADQKR